MKKRKLRNENPEYLQKLMSDLNKIYDVCEIALKKPLPYKLENRKHIKYDYEKLKQKYEIFKKHPLLINDFRETYDDMVWLAPIFRKILKRKSSEEDLKYDLIQIEVWLDHTADHIKRIQRTLKKLI